MRRFFVSILISIIIVVMISVFYFYHAGILLSTPQKDSSNRGQFLSPEFRDQLFYFLVTKMNIFEGNFEVIDVVNLAVHNFVGNDYVLITLRAPDGRICQVTAKRQAGRNAQWQFDEKSFSVIVLARYKPVLSEKDYSQISELNIGIGKSINSQGQSLLILETTARDNFRFLFFENVPSQLIIGINKNKKIAFSNQMLADAGPDVLWKPDYPTSYLGPGYRSYLYQKVKGGK